MSRGLGDVYKRQGSMEPKLMAALKFALRFPGKKAIITSLANAKDALENGAGTVITMA